MATNSRFDEGIPFPVSSADLGALESLAGTYGGLLDNDVVLVRGEPVPEIIQTTRELAQKIQAGIGSVASAETIGVLSLDESEINILESARRIQPVRLA